MVITGLLLISIAWLLQLLSKDKHVYIGFVVVYAVGVMFLVIDGYRSGTAGIAFLNFIILILALMVFFKLQSDKKSS